MHCFRGPGIPARNCHLVHKYPTSWKAYRHQRRGVLTHGAITEHTQVSLAFTVSGFTVHWLFFMLNNHPWNLLSFTPFPSKVTFKKNIPSPFLDFDLHISYHVSGYFIHILPSPLWSLELSISQWTHAIFKASDVFISHQMYSNRCN